MTASHTPADLTALRALAASGWDTWTAIPAPAEAEEAAYCGDCGLTHTGDCQADDCCICPPGQCPGADCPGSLI